MFCKPRPDKKIESMASILILGGVIPLCVAMVAQYRFHLPPCHFCLLQRYPYLVTVAMGALSLLVPRMSRRWQLFVLIGGLAFATTGGLGVYHTGIERGWIAYSGGCVADTKPAASLDEVRAQILQAPAVSCSDATANFLGLSMASWNSLFAFSMLLLTYLQYRFDRKIYARTSTP